MIRTRLRDYPIHQAAREARRKRRRKAIAQCKDEQLAPFADRVWALRNNLTSYDAWYVALAEVLDCPLVTIDRKLSRASGPRCEILVPPFS